ncbi:hypothetical protein AQI88_08700 [Streptomyces cellostaticus]|uniref:Secreted protein n=1 Tax=Streptomyces cellostaticus TaxID=67285 RepID=A0A101NQ21_9ACTN|nr:hypothetical protein [Streptomyces cellostaticus]KUM97330.1 hypothetical protein AQI88_08700 [Streptomyces cellostaticus]GHI03859.1 hypothetical protein Scel_21800 [Streptomyces cellostaticus]
MRASLVGTAVTLAAGALLTAAMTTASASPPDATAPKADLPRPVLVDCLWHRDVRPADFILACGDGNSRLLGLHWSQWGPNAATAVGVNAVNDCKPYCAAGTFHSYRVTVRLDRPQPWKKDPDVQHYTRMILTYQGARPDGFQQVVTYPLWD